MAYLAFDLVDEAHHTTAGTVSDRPFVPPPFSSKQVGQDFLFKLEMTQPIATFAVVQAKTRGAGTMIWA